MASIKRSRAPGARRCPISAVRLIDGWTRTAICSELGLKPPPRLGDRGTPGPEQGHGDRHSTEQGPASATHAGRASFNLIDRLRSKHKWTNVRIAEVLGVSHETVRRSVSTGVWRQNSPTPGRDGKKYQHQEGIQGRGRTSTREELPGVFMSRGTPTRPSAVRLASSAARYIATSMRPVVESRAASPRSDEPAPVQWPRTKPEPPRERRTTAEVQGHHSRRRATTTVLKREVHGQQVRKGDQTPGG